MDFKYLKLNGDATSCGPGSCEGPIVINLSYVMAVYEFIVSKDRAPLTRIWMSNGGMLQVKENVDAIKNWIAIAPMSTSPIVNEQKEDV